jgi:hypothetical protein
VPQLSAHPLAGIYSHKLQEIKMKYLILEIALLVVILGCQKKSDPVAPKENGWLGGTVVLHDYDGSIISDNSGVKIIVEGTTISTYTPFDGTWFMDGILSVDHTIKFSKTGYVTVKYFAPMGSASYRINDPILMGKIPLYKINQLNASSSRLDYSINISGVLSTVDTARRYVAVLFSDMPIDTSTSIKYFYELIVTVPQGTNSFNQSFFKDGYNDPRFLWSGHKMYVIAYPLPQGAPFVNVDYYPIDSRNVWDKNEIAPSNIDSLIVP